MTAGKYGSGEVVEGTVAVPTEVALPMAMGFIVSIFDDFVATAVRTANTVRPAVFSNHLITFFLIYQSVNVDVHWAEKN